VRRPDALYAAMADPSGRDCQEFRARLGGLTINPWLV
jgi:hypothetical protein